MHPRRKWGPVNGTQGQGKMMGRQRSPCNHGKPAGSATREEEDGQGCLVWHRLPWPECSLPFSLAAQLPYLPGCISARTKGILLGLPGVSWWSSTKSWPRRRVLEGWPGFLERERGPVPCPPSRYLVILDQWVTLKMEADDREWPAQP